MKERLSSGLPRLARTLLVLASVSSLGQGCFWHARRERVVYVEERRVEPREHRERRDEHREERREERR